MNTNPPWFYRYEFIDLAEVNEVHKLLEQDAELTRNVVTAGLPPDALTNRGYPKALYECYKATEWWCLESPKPIRAYDKWANIAGAATEHPELAADAFEAGHEWMEAIRYELECRKTCLYC